MENTPKDIIKTGKWKGFSQSEVIAYVKIWSVSTYYFDTDVNGDAVLLTGHVNDPATMHAESAFEPDLMPPKVGRYSVVDVVSSASSTTKKPCSCSMTDIMRHGCKCGGK